MQQVLKELNSPGLQSKKVPLKKSRKNVLRRGTKKVFQVPPPPPPLEFEQKGWGKERELSGEMVRLT